MVDRNAVEARILEILKKAGCTGNVPQHYIEEFCTCYVRWAECEEMNSRHGLIVKHPKTGEPIQSPYVEVGLKYLRQMNEAWDRITAKVASSKVRPLPRLDALGILCEVKKNM